MPDGTDIKKLKGYGTAGASAGGNKAAGGGKTAGAAAAGKPGAAGNGAASGASGQGADGREPKTGDGAHLEVYATIAMIAGLTYLLLYVMEESRGMSEREKDAFVAVFIRWGGGRKAARSGSAARSWQSSACLRIIMLPGSAWVGIHIYVIMNRK